MNSLYGIVIGFKLVSNFPEQIPDTTVDRLARSLFGFWFLAVLVAIVTWIAFLLSPVSPDLQFAQLRTIIILVFGGVVLFLIAMLVYLFRVPMKRLQSIAQLIVVLLEKSWLSLLIVLLLIEVNLVTWGALRYVAPAFTNPGKFLLLCWSLLIVGIVLLVQWRFLMHWLDQSRAIWVGVGLSLSAFAGFGLLYVLTSQAVQLTGLNDTLRGGLDYRELEFYDDGQTEPTAQDFWLEQSQTIVEWLPFSYWHVSAIQGEYVNVGTDGVRHTPSYTGDTDALTIAFFGGSTVWGEGARDAYTIPGHVARLLAEADAPQQVINYGQTGYVSTQDMILFQMQLLRGSQPDVAVFYQGFNDTLAALIQGYSGVTLQEDMRISDVEAGRLLRAGQPVLRLPSISLDDVDLSLAGVESADAQAIADRWFANVAMIQTLAAGYDVQVIFVWQPMISRKQSLTEIEQGILVQMEADYPGLTGLYEAVDELVQNRVSSENWDNIIILSDLFADDERSIFYDLVHVTEYGNLTIAEAILPEIQSYIEKN